MITLCEVTAQPKVLCAHCIHPEPLQRADLLKSPACANGFHGRACGGLAEENERGHGPACQCQCHRGEAA